jgi:hypothetical protein
MKKATTTTGEPAPLGYQIYLFLAATTLNRTNRVEEYVPLLLLVLPFEFWC